MSAIRSETAIGVVPHSAKPRTLRLRLVFWLDVGLLVSVCALETVPFTGMVLHEWLGLAVIAMVIAHLLLSWAWIASHTRRLLGRQSLRARVNYLLNLGLFGCITGVMWSGILISQDVIPALTGKPAADFRREFQWRFVHNDLSNYVLILAGLHLAINWDWSVAAATRILSRRKSA